MYPNPPFGGQPPGYTQPYQGDQQSYFQYAPTQQHQWDPSQPPQIHPPLPARSRLAPGGQGPQPCFNCGSIEHWAQYCPEPRRATPAGALTSQASNQGFTFQKPGGPTITRYAPPPTHQPAQLYGQPTPPSLSNGPPTPMSAYPKPYGQQWQQPPNNQFSPVSMQGSPYTPHTSHGYPTPITPYGSQYNGPTAISGQPHANINLNSQGQYQHQFGPIQPTDSKFNSNQQQPPHAPNQAPPHVSPQLSQSPYSPYGIQKFPQSNTQSSPTNDIQFAAQQGDVTYNPPTDQIWGPSQEGAQQSELAAPGNTMFTPSSLTYHANCGVIKWFPAEPVGRPLAATFSQAEAQGTLPPPPFDGGENSVSKYFSSRNFSEIIASIRDTDDWGFFKDDPMFREISDDKGLVPLDQLQMRLGQYGNGADQEEGESSSVSGRVDGKPSQHGWSVMDSLERALDTDNFSAVSSKAPQSKPEPFDIAEMEQLDKAEELTEMRFIQQSASSERHLSSRIDDAQEEMLARLGVTGSPKPVVPPLIRRNSRMPEPAYSQTSRRRSRSPAHDRLQSSGSRSSSTHTIPHQSYRERDPVQSYAEPRSVSRQNSYGVGDNHRSSVGSNNRRPSGSQYGHYPSYEKAPPPPPPPPLNDHFEIGVDECSPTSSQGNTHRLSHGSSMALSGNAISSSGRRSASPSGSRYRTSSSNARDYRERDNTRQPKEEPQRQADDLAAKRKRSQPQVSEVWLRRW